MPLPNITIELQNGQMGRVAATSDGVAGMVLTGTAEGDLVLNKAYRLGSVRQLATMKITEAVNPLVYKDVSKFYAKAGDGAELWILVTSAATTLEQMCGSGADSPLYRLITGAKGRIRLAGINRLAPEGYTAVTSATGIDADAVSAGTAAQILAENFEKKINPFRTMVPALYWNDAADNLFKPRESTSNRVGYVMAADAIINGQASAAIGEVLGVAASIAVNQSIARTKNGMIALEGWLTNGKTPEENELRLDELHDAGYIIYRTFVGRNGYYFNDDPMAAPVSDDYSNLSLGRTIDKAILLAYNAYIEELNDNVEVDENGNIPVPMCRYYEGLIENAVAANTEGEISEFEAFVDPEQNVLRDETLLVACSITPMGTLKNIKVTLGFKNPANQ